MLDKTKKAIENVLLEYMDYPYEETAFKDGYIPDIFNPAKLRDDLIKAFNELSGCHSITADDSIFLASISLRTAESVTSEERERLECIRNVVNARA